MADYLLVCEPDKFAEKFPDIDPCDDLGLSRADILGREVLLGRFFNSIASGAGEKYPGGYNRTDLARLLPHRFTQSNKHKFAQEVLTDERLLACDLNDWVELEGKSEEEFFAEPKYIELKASIETRKASGEYETSYY